MKNYKKLAVFSISIFGVLPLLGDLTSEWKDFIYCLSEKALAPKIIGLLEKGTRKPASDTVKNNIRIGLPVGLIFTLSQTKVDWNTLNGSQLCPYIKLPDALMGVIPSIFQTFIQIVMQGACLKGLSTMVSACEIPGNKLNENEYLLSEFSKCVATKLVSSETIQKKLGDKAYLRIALEGAVANGTYEMLFKLLQSKKAGDKTSVSLGRISSALYNTYLQGLLERTLSLPQDITSVLQNFLDSTLYTYGNKCLVLAKEKTKEALNKKLITEQKDTGSAQNLQVGMLPADKDKQAQLPQEAQIESTIPLAEDTDVEFVELT